MLVFKNNLITLDYTPDNDVLTVDWLNVPPLSMQEVLDTLEKIIEHIRNYDAKNMLMDSSTARMHVSPEDYRALMLDFISRLRTTRLKRIARVKSDEPERENHLNAVRQENPVTDQFQNFSTRAEALRWLTDENQRDREATVA